MRKNQPIQSALSIESDMPPQTSLAENRVATSNSIDSITLPSAENKLSEKSGAVTNPLNHNFEMKANSESSPVSESTQLNSTTEKSTKPASSINKKKSVKSITTSDADKSADAVSEAQSVAQIQSPLLFADEIETTNDTDSTMQLSETSKPEQADEISNADATNTPDQANAPESAISVGETKYSEESIEPEEPKATRMSRKHAKEELEVYKSEYLIPANISKRHTVVIEDTTWKELEFIVRRIGDMDSNTTGYINAILTHYLEEIKPKVEVWRKL